MHTGWYLLALLVQVCVCACVYTSCPWPCACVTAQHALIWVSSDSCVRMPAVPFCNLRWLFVDKTVSFSACCWLAGDTRPLWHHFDLSVGLPSPCLYYQRFCHVFTGNTFPVLEYLQKIFFVQNYRRNLTSVQVRLTTSVLDVAIFFLSPIFFPGVGPLR